MMKRRQFLAAGGISAATGIAAVGYVGPQNVIDFVTDGLSGLSNASLPEPVDESWTARERNPQNARYVDAETKLTGELRQYWEQEPDDAGAFRPETARVRDGVLYVSTDEDFTYAIRTTDGSIEWTTDTWAHDLVVPAGEDLYLSRTVPVDSETLVVIDRYDKATGEFGETLYERQIDHPLVDVVATDEHLIGKEKGYPGARVISRSSGEQVEYFPGANAYALSGTSLYVVSNDWSTLFAYDLESTTVQWRASDTWAEPYDPVFNMPTIRNDRIYVREAEESALLAYDADGNIVDRLSLPATTTRDLIVTPDTVYTEHPPKDPEPTESEDETGRVITYRREGGALSKAWESDPTMRHTHCAFENGLVACEKDRDHVQENMYVGVSVPSFFEGSAGTRLVDKSRMESHSVGPVFSNALFTFGGSVRAYGPA